MEVQFSTLEVDFKKQLDLSKSRIFAKKIYLSTSLSLKPESRFFDQYVECPILVYEFYDIRTEKLSLA